MSCLVVEPILTSALIVRTARQAIQWIQSRSYMLLQQIKKTISEFVAEHPGSTSIEIVVALFSKDNHSVDMPVVLEQMVNEGLLTELTYDSKPSCYVV